MTSALDRHVDTDAGRDAIAPRSLDIHCSAFEGDGGAEIPALSRYPHETHRVDFDEAREYGTADWEPSKLARANAIASRISSGPCAGLHTIMLDVDVPMRVVPSSTPGHSHLYIDRPLSWEAYVALIDALAVAGVIEDGYAAVSKERGFTRLRLPWIRKGKGTSNV